MDLDLFLSAVCWVSLCLWGWVLGQLTWVIWRGLVGRQAQEDQKKHLDRRPEQE